MIPRVNYANLAKADYTVSCKNKSSHPLEIKTLYFSFFYIP